MKSILIASVGGSRAPIAAALSSRRPDLAVFLASASAAGQPGSAEEVPAILREAQRPGQPHEIIAVPADEVDSPEAVFLKLSECIRAVRGRYPKAELRFDYTGGTKSMTSALFQVALATPGATLQFMGGRRATLTHVTPGTERPNVIAVDWLLAERTMARLQAAWGGFAYGEAAAGAQALLDDLAGDEKALPDLVRRLEDFVAASRAFDDWDRFRHSEAAQALEALAPRHPDLLPFAERARRCAGAEAPRLADLWRNAERCASRFRFDDAVARCYRLIEWVAQWRLRDRHGIDPSNMDWSRLSDQEVERIRAEDQRRRGRTTLSGLMQALDLLVAREPQGAMARFLAQPYPNRPRQTGDSRLRDMLELRNRSILAHGGQPLGEQDWARMAEFMAHFHATVLAPLLREAGAPHDPPQLPRRIPRSL